MKTATPKKTQTQRLLSYLRKHKKGITTMEAMRELDICRLSERIRELVNHPTHYIAIHKTRETAPNGSTVTRYRLSR